MAEIFTVVGVVVSVFVAISMTSLLVGLVTNPCDWELPSWIASVLMSTGFLSYFILVHILKLGQ